MTEEEINKLKGDEEEMFLIKIPFKLKKMSKHI